MGPVNRHFIKLYLQYIYILCIFGHNPRRLPKEGMNILSENIEIQYRRTE